LKLLETGVIDDGWKRDWRGDAFPPAAAVSSRPHPLTATGNLLSAHRPSPCLPTSECTVSPVGVMGCGYRCRWAL